MFSIPAYDINLPQEIVNEIYMKLYYFNLNLSLVLEIREKE